MLPRSGLLTLIDKHGSAAEKQLIGRWTPQIEAFMAAFSPGIQRGEQRLEIGLENTLVLKLVVKQAMLPPAEGLIRIAPTLPPSMTELARLAVAKGFKFHVGLRIQADACHREIYVYEKEDIFVRALATQGNVLPAPPPGLTVTAYGIDELSGISAYFTDTHNPLVQTHAYAIGVRVMDELKIRLDRERTGIWEHMRLRKGTWQSGKFGFEIKNVSLEVATRIISHYRPPYFRYLAPFRTYHAVVIAGSIETGIVGWYFNLE